MSNKNGMKEVFIKQVMDNIKNSISTSMMVDSVLNNQSIEQAITNAIKPHLDKDTVSDFYLDGVSSNSSVNVVFQIPIPINTLSFSIKEKPKELRITYHNDKIVYCNRKYIRNNNINVDNIYVVYIPRNCNKLDFIKQVNGIKDINEVDNLNYDTEIKDKLKQVLRNIKIKNIKEIL